MILKILLLVTTTPFAVLACDGKRDEAPRSPLYQDHSTLSNLIKAALIRTRSEQARYPDRKDRLDGEIRALKAAWKDGNTRLVQSKLPRDMQSRITTCELDFGVPINWD